MRAPSGPKAAKARPLAGKKVSVSTVAVLPPKRPSENRNRDDIDSPRLPPTPANAFASFLRSISSQASAEGQGRFCTEGPRLEFGGYEAPPADDVTSCPMRQVANRLQNAISQSAVLLLERVQGLKLPPDFDAAHGEKLLHLAQGVQAASYHIQKWASMLDSESPAPMRQPQASVAEEAMAHINISLPKIIIASSGLQAGLRKLVPGVTMPVDLDELTDEELERQLALEAEAKAQAEVKAHTDLERRGMSLQKLYSVVPHLEHLVYQASCLSNTLQASKAAGMRGGYVVAGDGETVELSANALLGPSDLAAPPN